MMENKKILIDISGTSEKYAIHPTKILCLGRNYVEHAVELHNEIPSVPLLFAKTLNVLIGPEENIIYPQILEDINKPRVDYEGELALIIGKRGKNIDKSIASKFIFGYTCFNDVTARDLQRNDISNKLPWLKSKSFDSFGPIGPKIALPKDIEDKQNLKIETRLNGKTVQSSNTKNMIFKVDYLIEYISKYFTLEIGDIIITGTPSGIGAIKKGDTVEVEIENIGILKNQMI
ncbi:MAG: fumarylacetoacetate hydrolase family protein [Promethearchaeota archaeon]